MLGNKNNFKNLVTQNAQVGLLQVGAQFLVCTMEQLLSQQLLALMQQNGVIA